MRNACDRDWKTQARRRLKTVIASLQPTSSIDRCLRLVEQCGQKAHQISCDRQLQCPLSVATSRAVGSKGASDFGAGFSLLSRLRAELHALPEELGIPTAAIQRTPCVSAAASPSSHVSHALPLRPLRVWCACDADALSLVPPRFVAMISRSTFLHHHASGPEIQLHCHLSPALSSAALCFVLRDDGGLEPHVGTTAGWEQSSTDDWSEPRRCRLGGIHHWRRHDGTTSCERGRVRWRVRGRGVGREPGEFLRHLILVPLRHERQAVRFGGAVEKHQHVRLARTGRLG